MIRESLQFDIDEDEFTDTIIYGSHLQTTGSGTKAEARQQARLMLAAGKLHDRLAELVEICRFKCSPHDEVILESGRTNHQALLDAVAVLESLEPPEGCTCDDPVTGAVPNYCRLHDGDYSSWLVSNNID